MDTPAVKRHEEHQYLDLITNVIASGNRKNDRTGVGTFSQFGNKMVFDIRNGVLPLLTTKSVFFKGVKEELAFFLRGDTNANHLSELGVRIWDGHSSPEFLASVGLGRREKGDIGPMYGWQWRHYGATYVDMHTDYRYKGIDQFRRVLNDITVDPFSRRIIMSAWNPADLPLGVLAPCHVLVQFDVSVDSTTGEKFLSSLLYQRSADIGLGVPFNIASYALLTHLIARACRIKTKEFTYVTGDTHIYLDHVEALREQAKRTPRPFPTLDLSEWPLSADPIDSFDKDLRTSHIKLVGYDPHPAIALKMAL